MEAGAALVEEERHGHRNGHAQVDEDVVAEQQRARHGNALECRGKRRALKDRLELVADGHITAGGHAHILADELPRAGAKDGQGQTRDILVGPERDGDEAVDEGPERAPQEGEQDGDEHGHQTVCVSAGHHLVIEGTA